MSIAPIGGVNATPPVNPAERATESQRTQGVDKAFANALDGVQSAIDRSEDLGRQLATGELTDVSQYLAAASKASVAVELTVAVRDRAIEAYQEIMRMQV